MGFRKGYFLPETGAPDPLTAVVLRRVRFEEVDPLGIVWHGRYPSYLEDGRAEFGRRFGLSYSMFKREQMAAPIVQMQIDYRRPLEFDQLFEVVTTLHWCDAMKLTFEYEIRLLPESYNPDHSPKNSKLSEVGAAGSEDVIIATASTVQLITDSRGTLLLTESGFVKEFRDRWRRGEFFV